ncbi:helix-turn-helix transcriptional regulator [Arcicella sp. LKC2W]|uniref:helix-turn-helix transcriptional regulator n=1 Tax=Arcicella sp. LKC2W TaxID=2984198 RepID=UPI002B1F73B4|nr:helix-turn-helix transcriptional regulator [Arcicella sp. LKC2W]MEA5459140.1 helix-turn-helix transcriptional regulator [Arcicella sp. LKC2W]
MNINKHFGQALKKYIEEKGIAINKQAEKLGVSYQGYLKYFESENPRLSTKQKILNSLGITEALLLGDLGHDEMVSRKDYEKLLVEKNQLLEEVAQYRLEKIKMLEAQNIRAESPIHQASTLHQ